MPVEMLIKKNKCSLCGQSNLQEIIELPQFPLTGIFVKLDTSGPRLNYDQALQFCSNCGHLQLKNVLPTAELYGTNYRHRSTLSHLAPSASSFFVDYVGRLTAGLVHDCVLEIGCNDLLLLKKLSPLGRRFIGVDPIWRDATPDVSENVKIVGEFVEEVNWVRELDVKPDLIVSTHNLEHLNEPVEQLGILLEVASENALFVIEVPDADLMVDNIRYDQVFHQHLHYFNLNTFLRMIQEIGATYVDHVYNYRNWGGSLCIAFKKGGAKSNAKVQYPRSQSSDSEYVSDGFRKFNNRMSGFMEIVNKMKCDVWGYGAGQMVPAVAYHLGTNLSFLSGIVDDDSNRHGLTYPGMSVPIVPVEQVSDWKNSAVTILALDGVRAIVNRLHQQQPRFVLAPINVF